MDLRIRGVVIWNSGLVRAASLPCAPSATGLGASHGRGDEAEVRLGLQISGDNHGAAQLVLPGRWARALSGIGPGDRVDVERPVAVAQDRGDDAVAAPSGVKWTVGDDTVFHIFHRTQYASIDRTLLDLDAVPTWLRLPATTKLPGGYEYAPFLCNLYDGVDTNVWAIFWENALPGPVHSPERLSTNITIVDASLESFPCATWSAPAMVQRCSLQVGLPKTALLSVSVSELPFLCLGDVVRAHRVKAYGKPPHFVNLKLQQYSAIVRFQDAAAAAADGLTGTGEAGDFLVQSLSGCEANTVTEKDVQLALTLHRWIQRRVGHETLSAYLTTVADMRATRPTCRDLIVRVVGVRESERVMLVEDGSSPEPLAVEAAQPSLAASWLFANVKPGHWLKLRNVTPPLGAGSGGDGLARVSAATITRLPSWSHDVVSRAQALAPKAGSTIAPVKEEQAEEEGRRGAWGVKSPPPVKEETFGTPPASAAAVMPMLAGTAPASAAPAARPPATPHAAAPAHALGILGPTRLVTAYAEDASAEECSRISSVKVGAEKGIRNFLLGEFFVVGFHGAFGEPSDRIESLVCARCRTCGHTFEHGAVGDVHTAKRRRLELPCGHWVFRLEYRFRLELCDKKDNTERLFVSVADGDGELFGGVRPEAVVIDPAAREQVQALIDGLRRSDDAQASKHTLAISRVDSPSAPGGAYVVCDTAIVVAARAGSGAEVAFAGAGAASAGAPGAGRDWVPGVGCSDEGIARSAAGTS